MRIPFITEQVRRVGIDLGSERVRIWTDRSGFAIDEPNLIAIDQRTKRILAVGREAEEMKGRVSKSVLVESPVKDGRVYDLEMAQALLKVLLQRVMSSTNLVSPVFMCSVPAESTEANLQAVTRLVYSLGAREVYTISQPLASSIGAGVPVADASGCFILQMGAGVVEGAVISLGSLVHHQGSQYAGDYLSGRLKLRLHQDLSLETSPQEVKLVKEKIASAYPAATRKQLVSGKDLSSGSPTEITVSAQDVSPEIEFVLGKYEQLLRTLLSSIPPELTVDVVDKGLLLAGGLANLDGVSQYFVERMGIPVSVVDEPEQAAIQGISTALEHLELFKESLGYQAP